MGRSSRRSLDLDFSMDLVDDDSDAITASDDDSDLTLIVDNENQFNPIQL